MNISDFTFTPLGSQAVLIGREGKMDEDRLKVLNHIKNIIEKRKHKEIIEVVNAYNSLLIKYIFPIQNFSKEISGLRNLMASGETVEKEKHWLFYLPICYDKKFGMDIEELASKNGLDPWTIPKLHSDPLYVIYFIGFLPGFPYLGGLPSALFCDRKPVPRKKVPKGAVGIGGAMTGIYPVSSPGGWHIIGNCPVQIFDPHKAPPCLFGPGDRIKFYPVSLKEHQEISAAVNTNTFQIAKKEYVH